MKEFDFEDVKEFVGGYIQSADLFASTREEVMNCRAIAFGAIRFAQSIELVSFKKIEEYWSYAWNRFEEIANEKGKGPKVEVI